MAVSARCPPRWSHRCCMVLKLLSMVLYERDALLALSLEVPVALSKVCACCAGWRVVGAFVRRLAQCRVQGPNAFICLIIFILSASSAYSSSFHLQLRRRQHWQMLESRATARRREENVFGVLDFMGGLAGGRVRSRNNRGTPKKKSCSLNSGLPGSRVIQRQGKSSSTMLAKKWCKWIRKMKISENL